MTHYKELRFTVLGVFCIAAFCYDVLAQKPLGAASGPFKKNIAVINLKSGSGVNASESELISDRLRGDLFNTDKVNVMERDQMQEILKEQGFQASGACTDEACLVQMGQLLGVEMLITGSLGKLGSMFLVNVRMIDVKTAKIVKVVSVDVKGDIEDVVGRLKNIAEQLVGEQQAPTRSLNEAPSAPIESKKEEPKEESKKGPIKVEKAEIEKPKEEKKEEAEVTDNDLSWKTKNRSGIRLVVNRLLGPYNEQGHWIYNNTYGTKYSERKTALDSLYPETNVSGFVNMGVLFSIRAGQIFVIDIGPSFTYGDVSYRKGVSNAVTISNTLGIFSFHSGLNFVKRWYPFKMNIGILIEANYLNYAETFPVTDSYGFTSDSTIYSHGFNFSFGLRTSGEYLIGKHFGINVDIDFIRSNYETLTESYDNYNNGTWIGTYDFSRIIDLPPILLGIGFNFYY